MPFTVEQLPEEFTLSAVHTRISDYGDDYLPERGTKHRIPLGIGGEDNEPILFDPGETPMLPIYGTSQSGKTTMLVTIVNGALAGGYRVILAAPKNNALRAFVDKPGVERIITLPSELTEELLSQYADDPKTLFVFDDCQLLKDVPASNWLQSKIGVLDANSAGFVVAGDAAEFPTGFGNWGSKVKTIRQGALLKPDEVIYQDRINIRLRRAQLTADVPSGRGFVHMGALSVTMQVASSEPMDGVPEAGPQDTLLTAVEAIPAPPMPQEPQSETPAIPPAPRTGR